MTQMLVSNYIKTYYDQWMPNLGADFVLQEQSRELSAKLYDLSDPNGQVSLATIQCLREAMSPQLSDTFKTFIDKQLSSLLTKDQTSKKDNVRGPVRAIWTFPLQTYMPWMPVQKDKADAIMQVAKQIVENQNAQEHVKNNELGPVKDQAQGGAKLVAIQGKTIKFELDNFQKKIWQDEKGHAACSSAIPGVVLHENPATSHLTLILSDVLAKVDPNEFASFFEQESKTLCDVDLTPTSVEHTFSADYAVFWACVVVRFSSKALSGFIERANIKFASVLKQPLKPSLHITIAIAPRGV